MNLIVILLSSLLSLSLGYFILLPFLSSVDKPVELDLDNYEDAVKESFKTALESLDLALENASISNEEYQIQKQLLLRDASLRVESKKNS